MSADNGIYIAKFPDGFRVVHAQAIEDIDYYPEGTDEYLDTLKFYFGGSPLYNSKEEAFEAAHDIEEDILADDFCPILEYGICYLGDLPSFEKQIIK